MFCKIKIYSFSDTSSETASPQFPLSLQNRVQGSGKRLFAQRKSARQRRKVAKYCIRRIKGLNRAKMPVKNQDTTEVVFLLPTSHK
jgi:hypothetical protein